MVQMSIDEILRRLEAIGWMDHVSDTKRDSMRADLEHWHKSNPEWTYLGLATSGYDAECIEDDDSYPMLMKSYIAASGGVFDPTDIESMAEYDEKATVSFNYRGQRFETELPFESDYVDEGFEPFLNQVLERSGVTQRFFTLPPIDQLGYLVFVPPNVYALAEQQGILPKQELPDDEDWEDEDADDDD